MKNRILPMTLVASAGLLTGCAHNSEYTSSSDRHRTTTGTDAGDHSRYPKDGTYATATTPSTTTPTRSTTPAATYRTDTTMTRTGQPTAQPTGSTTEQARATDQYGSSDHTGNPPAAGTTSTTTTRSTTGTTSTRSSGTALASGQSTTNEWYDTDRDVVMSPSGEVREFDRTGESTRIASGTDRMEDRARTGQPATQPSGQPSQPVTTSSATRSSTTQPSSTPSGTQPSGTYTTGQTRDPNRATDQYGSSDHSGPAPTTDTVAARPNEPKTDTYKSDTTKTDVARTDTSRSQPAKTEYSKTETTDTRYTDAQRTSQASRDTRTTTDRTRTSDDWARRDRDAGRYRDVAYTPVVKTNDAYGSSPYSPANMGRTTAEYDPRGIEPITREGVAVAPAGAAQPTTKWVVDSDSHDTRGSAPYTPANRGMNTAAEDVQTASVPVTGTMPDGRAATGARGTAASTTAMDDTRRRHADAMASQQGQPASQDWTNRQDGTVATRQDWNQPSQPIDPGQPVVATAQPDRTQPGVDRRVQPDRTTPSDRTVQPMTDAFAGANAETRILSILQVKDQEEIEIGKLAQERGRSEAVRQFGQTLERDHSGHLEKVRSTAQSAGVTLLTTEQTKAAMKLEKERRPDLYGMPMDPGHMTDKDMKPVDRDGKPEWDDTHKDPGDVRKEQPVPSDPTQTTPPVNPDRTNPDRTNPPKDQPSDTTRIREGGSPRQEGSAYGKDLLEELRAAEGDRFDALFAQKMHMGHGKVIRIVEDAQKKVTDPGVRDLLAKTLPTLREHERMAQQLVAQNPELPGQKPLPGDRPSTDRPRTDEPRPTTPR